MTNLFKVIFLISILFSGAGTIAVYGQGSGDTLQSFRDLMHAGKSDQALTVLENLYTTEKSPIMRAKLAFALGVLNFRADKMAVAGSFLNASLELKTHLDDYAHYYIGLIQRDAHDLNGARQHFQSVRTHHPPSLREADAEIELAQIAKDQEHWREAHELLSHLERKHHGDPQYQDILYNLVEASLNYKKPLDACRAALRIYSKYPLFSMSKGWGMDMNKVSIKTSKGEIPLHCVVSNKDRDKRLQQLIVAGEFDEVKTEINDWLQIIRADPKPHAEELGKIELEEGQLSLAGGKVKEAIAHFQTAQDMLGRNFSAQMLLAKAYSQTDDYSAAVDGYAQAFDLSPKSKLGQKALFQAAFLCYQNHDYDNAAKRFEEITHKIKGPLMWDARWHLAWIRYLKKDYAEAEKEFLTLSKGRQPLKSVDQEKLNYWIAMAQFRNGNLDGARTIFAQLASKKRLGYYTAASLARLAVLPAPAVPSIISPTPTPAPSPAPVVEPSPSPGTSTPPGTATGPSNVDAPRHVASTDEGLGDSKESAETPAESNAEEESENQPINKESAETPVDNPIITSLKNPALVARFERAIDLIDLGFDQWAVFELREIERRTSNHGYLQTLMSEYLKAGDFFRSAFIADVIFETDRERNGIDGAQPLWSYAFPQAFDQFVSDSSKKFNVPSALVLSIMRGESGFRQDIHSSAGALGLMQLIPPTAKRIATHLGFKDYKNAMLLTPELNILFGTKYLSHLNKVMAANLGLVVASYNAGPHRVQGWLRDFGDLDMDEFVEHIPYLETRNYVKKVLRNYFVYTELYDKKNSNPLQALALKPTIKFTGPKPTSESWEDLQ